MSQTSQLDKAHMKFQKYLHLFLVMLTSPRINTTVRGLTAGNNWKCPPLLLLWLFPNWNPA